MAKSLEKMTHEELVEYCAEIVLKELLNGSFRTGIYLAVVAAVNWEQAQKKNEK